MKDQFIKRQILLYHLFRHEGKVWIWDTDYNWPSDSSCFSLFLPHSLFTWVDNDDLSILWQIK